MYDITKPIAALAFGLLPTTGLADFSGAYAGGAIASVSSGVEIAFEIEDIDLEADLGELGLEDTAAFSGFAGYQIQSGAFVYGGEIASTRTSGLELLGLEVDATMTDVKGRIGYVFEDKFVTYGTLGYSTVTVKLEEFDTDIEIDADGFVLGAGVDYLMTDNLVLGVEFSSRQVTPDIDDLIDEDDLGFELDTDLGLNINSIAVRVAYKF